VFQMHLGDEKIIKNWELDLGEETSS